MNPSPPTPTKMNQLNIAGDEAETVISSSGEGWSLRVLMGFPVGLLLAFCGAIITLGIVSAAVVGLSNGEWHASLMLFLVAAVPVCMGGIFALHYFRLGWNTTTITITKDRLAIRYDGKFSRKSYRIPLADIKRLTVRAVWGRPNLEIRLWFRDFRTLLQQGTKEELHWVERLIRSRLIDGGWARP